MIVRYRTSSGDVLGYTAIGGVIPDDIPEDTSYLNWFGITPEPSYNFTVSNGIVERKLESDKTAYNNAMQLRSIRGQRDELLLASDYTQIPDVPESSFAGTRAQWATYRQALRDFTDTVDLTNIVWPTEPT